MGKPRENSHGKAHPEPCIQHFSHEHPLELFNIEEQPLNTCSGCKLKPSSEWVYGCKQCNYILHTRCSQMPQLIRHPADPNHSLTLLVRSAYQDGRFRCDACGEEGNGFCYSCSTCGLDIHILCATMPLSVTNQNHPHPLSLTFSPPYPTKLFSCDICHNPGFDHWLYRCNACGLDAHLNCATIKPPIASVPQHQSRSPQPQPQPQPQPHYPSFPLTTNPFLQPVGSYSAEQQANRDLIQSFVAAQHSDNKLLTSIVQGNNGAAAAQFQEFIQGNNGISGTWLKEQYNGTSAARQEEQYQRLQNFIRGSNGGNGVATQTEAQQVHDTFMESIMGGSPGGLRPVQQFGEKILRDNSDAIATLRQMGENMLQHLMGGTDGGYGADGSPSTSAHLKGFN